MDDLASAQKREYLWYLSL